MVISEIKNHKLALVMPALVAVMAGLSLVINVEVGFALFLAAVVILFVLRYPEALIYLFIASLPLDGLKLIEGSSIPRLIGVAAFLMFLLLVLLKKIKVSWSSVDVAMVIFYLIAGISVAYSTDQEVALTAFLRLSMLFVMYALISNFSVDEARIKRILWFYSVGCIISILIGFSTGELLGGRFYGRLAGGMSEPNELVQMLTVVFPFIIFASQLHEKTSTRIIAYFIAGLFLFAMVLSGSRGGVISFALMLSLVLYDLVFRQKRRRIMLLVGGVIVATLYFTPVATLERLSTIPNPNMEKGFSTKYRLTNYQAALNMFIDNPMGVGLRNFAVNNTAYGAYIPNLIVHNTYLEILTGTGFLGLTAYLAVVLLTFRNLIAFSRYGTDKKLAMVLMVGYIGLLSAGIFLSSDLEKVTFLIPAIASGMSKRKISLDNKT